MKQKLLLAILFLCTGLFAFSSCESDDAAEKTPEKPGEVSLPNEQTILTSLANSKEYTLDVAATSDNTEWFFSAKDMVIDQSGVGQTEWYTIDPALGKGAAKVTVTVKKNESGLMRSATISLKTSDKDDGTAILLSQSKDDVGEDLGEISIAEGDKEVAFVVAGEQKTITVTATTETTVWKITPQDAEASADWYSIDPKSGVGSGTINITVTKNEKTTPNTAILLLEGPTESNKISVTITQPGADEVIVTPPVTGVVELDKLYGYGVGTTGGEGAMKANIHHFNNGKKLQEWLVTRGKSSTLQPPTIIWLSGTFTKDDGRNSSSPWFDIKNVANISFYGIDDFVMQNIGFFCSKAENIIIRNINIKMPKATSGADGISMQNSKNMWIDHCTFKCEDSSYDYEDGSCDVTHGTTNVTISWNHFVETQKTSLIGHSNTIGSDTENDPDIKVTYHHNFFDRSSSRHPRVRFGTAHVYNNYYNKVSTYGAGSACGAMVLLEDNFFDGVHLPTDIATYPAKLDGGSWISNLRDAKAGFLYERANKYINQPNNSSDPYPFINLEYTVYDKEDSKLLASLTYNDFKPAYDYIVDPTDQLATIIESSSGYGKLSGFAVAPIEVNNGGLGTTPDPDPDPDPDPNPSAEIGNGWFATSIGEAQAMNTIGSDFKTITMVGSGKFESGNQAFSYVYREVTGDFTATVRIDASTFPVPKNQGYAALIFTPDLTQTDINFVFALAGQGADGGFHGYHRLAAELNGSRGGLTTAPSESGGDTYLRLKREGGKYYADYSLDGGVTWSGSRNNTFISELPEKIYVGVSISSSDAKATASATFSDFRINDGAPIDFGVAAR